MLDHFVAYTERFDEKGQLTEALLQIGRAYEFLNQPTEMLALYRKSISRFANDPNNFGVDALIEAYTEKYISNLRQLKRTVEFLDQIRDDLAFRKLMVSDRGALFEEFYNNPDIIQDLYNDLRKDPAFNLGLMEDLSPIEPISIIYREQLGKYPKDTPETYFRQKLIHYQSKDQAIAESRMLMGLYRNDVVLDPTTPYDESSEYRQPKTAALRCRLLPRKKISSALYLYGINCSNASLGTMPPSLPTSVSPTITRPVDVPNKPCKTWTQRQTHSRGHLNCL